MENILLFQLKQHPIYCDWVKTLIKFNSDLVKIIDELQKKLNEKGHVNYMNGNKHIEEVIENDRFVSLFCCFISVLTKFIQIYF